MIIKKIKNTKIQKIKKKKKNKKETKVNVKKADIMKQNIEKDKNKKEILKFLSNLDLDKHYPFKKNKLHESFKYYILGMLSHKKI